MLEPRDAAAHYAPPQVLAAWPWNWSSSAWSGITFLALVVAAYIAWRQVKEAQRLREEQARPFVIIDFHAWQTIVELTIKNIGATMAWDVRFTFTPSLKTTHDDGPGRGDLMELNIFKNGIRSLPPNKEMRLFFDQFPARIAAGLPMTYAVDISYRDPKGKRYTEQTVLDLAVYLGTGGITRHGIHEIHREIKNIADTIKKWTDWYGLKIVTQTDIDERNAEYLRQDAEAEAAEQAKQEPDS